MYEFISILNCSIVNGIIRLASSKGSNVAQLVVNDMTCVSKQLHTFTEWTVVSLYHRKYKSLVVVGVLPYQVDSSRSTHRHLRRLAPEHLPVHPPSVRLQLGHAGKGTGHWATEATSTRLDSSVTNYISDNREGGTYEHKRPKYKTRNINM